MISMLPLRNEEKLKELNELNGTNSRLAYCLYDAGKITAYCLYGLVDKTMANIDVVKTDDVNLFDGIVRAVMGSLYDIGVEKIIYSEKVEDKFLKYLGFTDGTSKITNNIEDVLFKCKHCKK